MVLERSGQRLGLILGRLREESVPFDRGLAAPLAEAATEGIDEGIGRQPRNVPEEAMTFSSSTSAASKPAWSARRHCPRRRSRRGWLPS